MKRFLVASSIGLIITLSLFLFMSALISTNQQFKKTADSGAPIEFIRLKQDSHLDLRKRTLPKKPPEPKKMPETPKMKITQKDQSPTPKLNMPIPNLDVSMKGDGPFLGQAQMGSGTSALMPLVRIEPRYPRKAAMKGIQGWVKLKFDITKFGTVENVNILEAQPPRIFDSEAKRALLKYKYKPLTVDGKPVASRNQKLIIDFKLEGSE